MSAWVGLTGFAAYSIYAENNQFAQNTGETVHYVVAHNMLTLERTSRASGRYGFWHCMVLSEVTRKIALRVDAFGFLKR